ncbi:scy1 protein kinase [Plasmopara halstedii]|uniref:Scy1 protein kinase n=1 Tax=Plasmopara halstedii TaxID=4781 RepID=A0A0N7L540_PLAHL|nr:scy1 protein kinase [Plasmopara halstedii]CEG40411.1 scy1 protein kinase [Plasmopara halstedii]|eukprot:XP_024576780.1 scy1 protein kinase [Plasmopara halstedii]
MNFLKTLGGLVGSSTTGGLPYSIDTPSVDGNVAAGGDAGECVVFEGLPDFILHSGKSKQDPSHVVSIFKSRQPAGQLTSNSLHRIKTLRHPNILAYLDGIEVPNNGPVIIITEHVMPLSEFLTALRMEYGNNSEEFTMCVSWGLRSILMALQFINVDCKLLHGRLTPQSIFVTKGGDWKLGGFELTAEKTNDGPSSIYTLNQQYVDINYKPPECQRSDWKAVATGPAYGVDMWAFGCLMYYIFTDGHFRSSDKLTAVNLPSALQPQFRKTIDENPSRRLSPQMMLKGNYFDTPFIRRMDFLENLAVMESDEKVAFYKELCANLASIPRCFGVHKILPALKQVVEFGAAIGIKNGLLKLDPSASHMLPAMVQIGSSLSTEEFKTQIIPILLKLFSCSDRAVRVQLLQMMEKFAVHFDAKLVNSSVVFDNLCSGFTDAAPVLRELTVKSMLHIADKLSDNNLNNRVVKYFAKLQSDPEPAIRTNTTICIGKIASKLNETTRPKVLFPAFAKALNDPFPHARLAGLRSMIACQEYFTPQGMAGSVIPAISPLLLDVSITVREQAKTSIDIFIKAVNNEANQMKVREELEAKKSELKGAEQESDHLGGACETTPPPSNGGHTSGSYASSLTAWASSAVTSNVNKLVGSGILSSAPTSHTFSHPGNFSQNTNNSSIPPSSRQDTRKAFAADNVSAENGWGDSNRLGGYDRPYLTTSRLSASQSVNEGASTSVTPEATSLSASATSSSKLNFACKTSSGSNSSTTRTTSTFLDLRDCDWEDDNWGGDDDLDLGASEPKSNTLGAYQPKGSRDVSTSTVAQGKAGRKSTREADTKNKAKRGSLGSMKLDTVVTANVDEWKWDF